MESENKRAMVTYPETKSDPICKWRTASVATVAELVSVLPKTPMSKQRFREKMSQCYGGSFFRTPYQLALQLALYYEDETVYIPRFDHNITNDEALNYMYIWMQRYYVPNPFTKRGFVDIEPMNLLNGIADYLEKCPTKPNLATAGAAMFGGIMGNLGCVKFILNNYSKVISIDEDNNIKLLSNNFGDVNVGCLRDDKKAFFEYFK